MSSTLESIPSESERVHVVLKIKGHMKDDAVFCTIPNQEECKWDDILKKLVNKSYADMRIGEEKLDKDIMEFDAWFVNRAAREDDVYSKLNRIFYLNKSIVPDSLIVAKNH